MSPAPFRINPQTARAAVPVELLSVTGRVCVRLLSVHARERRSPVDFAFRAVSGKPSKKQGRSATGVTGRGWADASLEA